MPIKLRLLVASACIATSLSITPAAMATDCAGRLCAYDDNNYVGLLGRVGTAGVTYNFSGGSNDQTSSLRNETQLDGIYYEGADLKGAWSICQNSVSNNPYVGNFYNDEISSMYLYSNNAAC